MMADMIPKLLTLAGTGQLCILIASALVPIRLNWRRDLQSLPRLHRQMCWTYGGYVVLSIIAFALISIVNSRELAGGSGLSRGFCAYVAIFWGIRLSLQAVFDVKEHLTTWWLKLGYASLTVLFTCFAALYGWVALRGA